MFSIIKNKIIEIIDSMSDEQQNTTFNFYLKLLEQVENLNLVTEWRYYKDTKSWLGKILNKKKFRLVIYMEYRV